MIQQLSHNPGSSEAMIAELNKYVIVEPYPFVVDLAHSKGMYLATVEGRRLFDWAGYYGAKLLTHNHPGLYEDDYVRRLVVAANNKVANPDFLTPECLAYYRLLHRLAPRCMRNPRLEVYAINSGAEAVENMMKYFINLHHQRLAKEGKPRPATRRFIYFDQAFHGRTLGTLNVTQLTHDPVITKDFQGYVRGNIKVPFPFVDHSQSRDENLERMNQTLETLEHVIPTFEDEVVGIIVEPLQGAGGHRVAYPEFFRRLSDLAHRFNIYLGFDEVQTAGGQCGTVFACDQFDLPHPPQAVAVAKKMATGAVYMLYPMDDHGVLDSTWGGHLADMVRFDREWEIVTDGQLVEQVPAKAGHLVARLESLGEKYPALVYNVRGLGLYQGFSLRPPLTKGKLTDAAYEREDLLILGAGTNSIRLRPPLDVTVEDIDLLIEKLDRCLASLASS